LKQTQNRPVEALQDLQKSIELNDNRAVYRSRLLLDQDLAARTVNLAQIYRDTGFDQLAVAEARKAVAMDPNGYAAHQFLADSYQGVPRQEAARDAEQLQALIRAPIGIIPVYPFRDISTPLPNVPNAARPVLAPSVTPLRASINTYDALYDRPGLRLFGDALVASQESQFIALPRVLLVVRLTDVAAYQRITRIEYHRNLDLLTPADQIAFTNHRKAEAGPWQWIA
jgi:hypothetical protein